MKKLLFFSLASFLCCSVIKLNAQSVTLFDFSTNTDDVKVVDAGGVINPSTHSSEATIDADNGGCPLNGTLPAGVVGGYGAFVDETGGSNFFVYDVGGQDLSFYEDDYLTFYWMNGTYDGAGELDGTPSNQRIDFWGNGGQNAFISYDVTALGINSGWHAISILLDDALWANQDLGNILADLDSMKIEVEAVSSRQLGSTYINEGGMPVITTCADAEYIAMDEIAFSTTVLSFDLISTEHSHSSVLSDEFQIVEVYPVPASNDLTVSVNTVEDGLLNFSIVTLEGKVVDRENVFSNKGENTFKFDISGLAKGMYILNIVNPTQESSVSKITVE